MNPLLSIIVPIYNVEPYLQACIDSILRQKFTDYELILIDDGSPDNCGKICDEYASTDSRIIVIHKKNGGVSSARNTGLDVAHGDYITFVDPDDELEETYEKNMHILISNPHIDMLQFPRYCEVTDHHYSLEAELTLTGIDNIFAAWIEQKILTDLVWHKIYKKIIWENIKFPDGRVHEDLYVILDIITKTKCFFLSKEGTYIYKNRENSITTSPFTLKRQLDLLAAKLHILSTVKKINISNHLKNIVVTDVFRNILRLQLSNKDLDLVSEFTEVKKNLSSICIFKNINLSSIDSVFFLCKFFACYILLRFCSAKLFVRILLLTK